MLLPVEHFTPLLKSISGKRIFYIKQAGNVGDDLIHLGASRLFELAGATMVKSIEGSELAVIAGGGNWGKYAQAATLRARWYPAIREHALPLIVWPQTIFSLDEEPLPPGLKTFFVRERHSLSLMPDAILAPDAALACEPPGDLPDPEARTGIFLRNDCESCFAGIPVGGDFQGDSVAICQRDPMAYIRMAARFETIFTDRLHFAVAGLLAGRDVTLLPNNYPKNRHMWEAWLESIGCRWADKPPAQPAPRPARSAEKTTAKIARYLRQLKKPRIAITMCVHNEERFLEAHLRYHQAIGVERAFVFLDACTDRSLEICRQFPWVDVFERPKPANLKILHNWQNECADEAAALALDCGMQWLLHIDPDEFAFGNNPALQSRGGRAPDPGTKLLHRASLHGMIARTPPEIDQIVMAPRESFPVLRDSGKPFSPFWQNPYLQKTEPLPREVMDPLTGEVRIVDRNYGHVMGKALVRLSKDLRAVNPHSWGRLHRFGGILPLSTKRQGFHVHYFIVSPDQWLKKFQRESALSNVWANGGNVHFPKAQWRRAAPEMTLESCHEYLGKWVFSSEKDALRLVDSGDISHFDAVPAILARVCKMQPR